jgi:hypothetical protein
VCPFASNVAQFSESRQFVAQFAASMHELRHNPIFAEKETLNLRMKCGENIDATNRSVRGSALTSKSHLFAH